MTNFYHSTSGGIKTYIDAQTEYLKAHGLPVLHVFPGEKNSLEQPDELTKIYRVAAHPAPVNDEYRLIWDLSTVVGIILREKPDILEVNDKYSLCYAALMAKFAGDRSIAVGFIHDRLDDTLEMYWEPPWFGRFTSKLFMPLILSCFDEIICASQFVADEFKSYKGDKTHIVNLGVETDVFSPEYRDEDLKRQYCPNGEALLLYVGRLAKEKNIKLLPKVIERLSNLGLRAKLLVAGAGPEEDVLRSIPVEKRIMAGYVHDRETLCKLKATADVLLFPSLREPFGLTPLEALASGCPVVAVNEGGPMEYSGSPAIRTVAGTAEAFADEVVDILKEDSNELRKEARKHARKYSWDNTFEKQLALYKKLIESYS